MPCLQPPSTRNLGDYLSVLAGMPSERKLDSYMHQARIRGLAVHQVLICLIKNPWRHLIRRWNYKTACLSALSRGTAILLANLSSGGSNAAGAMLAEMCYRTLASGFYSSAIQSLRYARPFWGAWIVSMTLIPAFSESVDFALHRLRGTQRIGATMIVSMSFTTISTLLELLAMRRGLLIVGKTSGSLIQDLKKLFGLTWVFRGRMVRNVALLAPKTSSARRPAQACIR